MTIQGTRGAAAGFALAGAVVVVLVAVSASVLKQPGLLLLVALFASIDVVVVLLMLRPTTLTFDGADVVYRTSGRETRTPRKDIAACVLTAQGSWVFSNSAGARLFTMPALRFSQTDVAAFCNQAGINFPTTPARPVDQSRKDVSSAKLTRALGVGITVLLLLGAGGAIYASFSAQDELRRYQSAPACADGERPTSTCRLQTQARVLSTELSNRKIFTTLHLSLIGAGGDYVASVDSSGAPKTGDIVNVEVWSRKVTRLGGTPTGGNPEINPSLNIVGVVVVIGLFAALTFGIAVVGHVQLQLARARLRAATTAEGSSVEHVQAVHPDSAIDAAGLPPCGIAHHPKEVFFAHPDPKMERTGVLIGTVIAVVVLAVLALLAVNISIPIFGGIAALGLAWYGLQLFGAWRETRLGGVFADDLHVGKITSSSFYARLVRKVYDRTSVLQCNVDGQKLTVVGLDGSTLFWTALLAPKDVDRFVEFVGSRTVVEEPPEQQDPIASAPISTPLGVLPLNVRRAAGLMQSIGGLMLGLGVVNLIRIPGLSADNRTHLLELLVSMAVYGGAIAWLGWRLARGRPNSREVALIGGGIATVFLIVVEFLVYTGPFDLYLYAILDIGTLAAYGLAVYWLRDSTLSAGPSRSR